MIDVYAHLGGASGRPHGLVEHLRDVARRASELAHAADPGLAQAADVAGWLQDLGKFRPPFEQYFRGLWPGPEKEKRHAVFGAAAADLAGMTSVSFAVLGHHAGLHDFGLDGYQGNLNDADLSPMTAAPMLMDQLEAAMAGGPIPWRPPADDPLRDAALRIATEPASLDPELRARTLFSCLVDADYLDTEKYFTGEEREPNPFDPSALIARLSAYMAGVAGRVEETPVNATRRDVRESCMRWAAQPPGLFSLTAPTGSGKTLAAMAFALEHAKAHGLRRVIVVLPFLAIVEQNARVYRDALNRVGAKDVVLERHSAVAVEDGEGTSASRSRTRGATENWDAPVVVTTAVQFLESLFSRHPGRFPRRGRSSVTNRARDSSRARYYIPNNPGTNRVSIRAARPNFGEEARRTLKKRSGSGKSGCLRLYSFKGVNKEGEKFICQVHGPYSTCLKQ